MTRAAAWLATHLSFVIVPAWIVAAVAAVHYLPDLSQTTAKTSAAGGLVPSGAPALLAQRREVQAFGSTIVTPVVVVQRAARGLTRPQLRRTAEAALAVDQRHARPPIAFVVPLVSRDGTTTVSYLYFRPSVAPDDQLSAAQQYARSLDPAGLRGGALLARSSEFDEIERALPKVTIATIALIVVLLLLTFRAVAAPLVVLAAAGIAYVISVHLLGWLGSEQSRQVPKEVEPILIALLLGLVTDYSVFFLTSTRRRLREGQGRFDAATAAATENLPIVFTAGLIVALGSLTLVSGRLDVFRAFGPGMALAVVVAIAVSLTFIPAVLALLGRWVFWPSLGESDREPRRGAWRILTARPVSGLVVIVATAALLVLSAGLLHLRLGFTLVRGLPSHSESKKAQTLAEQSFPKGILAPTEVLLEGTRLNQRRPALARLQRELRTIPGVALVVGPGDQPQRLDRPVFVSRAGQAARYAVVLDQEPLDANAIDALGRVQKAMPRLLRRARLEGSRVSYAGETALAQNTVTTIRSDGIRVGVAVVLVNFVLLALFLRSIGAPLYLLAASLLALGAALGATAWVMTRLLGHDDMTYYVPFAAGVLLLSLGSDYNVFVVGRIWQAAREMPLRDAIADVAPRTSAAVTIAGLTLAGSFALIALVPVRAMRELAFAMAVGILIDTFIVRSVLVPTLLALFRREQRSP